MSSSATIAKRRKNFIERLLRISIPASVSKCDRYSRFSAGKNSIENSDIFSEKQIGVSIEDLLADWLPWDAEESDLRQLRKRIARMPGSSVIALASTQLKVNELAVAYHISRCLHHKKVWRCDFRLQPALRQIELRKIMAFSARFWECIFPKPDTAEHRRACPVSFKLSTITTYAGQQFGT